MLTIVVLKENETENRVAVTPDVAKSYITSGYKILLETDAGMRAGFPNALYKDLGAEIVSKRSDALKKADVVLSVNSPDEKDLTHIKKGATLISIMNPFRKDHFFKAVAKANLNAIALEFMPRITRAQNMDVLSSQANLAGYRAVIEAAYCYGKGFPMMMTAAGTIAPARVFVMGTGVAGLQAIATAKRLGGIVSATDVRPAAKEQVESLGGSFIMVESDEVKEAETAGGYAKEMSKEFQKAQAELIAQTMPKQDIVITTALIPGRPAPVLVTKEMVKAMKPGSVILDMATAQGGNCEMSKKDDIVEVNGVKIIGYSNLPSRIASDASRLYAKNIQHLLTHLMQEGKLVLDAVDEITKAILLVKDAKIIHEKLAA